MCLRINTQHQLIMQKRRIPSLDTFLNAITLQLWPRFQSILDLHIESVRKAAGAGSSTISLFSTPEIHPHFITRRYGEFAASILQLNQGYNDHLLETRYASNAYAYKESLYFETIISTPPPLPLTVVCCD